MDQTSEMYHYEGLGTTVVHPLGALMLLACGLSFVLCPRKYAVWPLLILVFFVSARQCIAIGGFNLYFIRFFVVFFAPLRMVMQGERIRMTSIDWCVVAYGITYLLTGIINWDLSLVMLKMRLGFVLEIVILYLVIRSVIQTKEDVDSVINGIAIMAFPLAFFFLLEYQTGRNVFAIFGGIPEMTLMRDGKMRCQGAFAHPILAGVTWAAFMPLLMYRAKERGIFKPMSIAPMIAACVIIATTTSSTPILGLAVGIVGTMLFPLRRFTGLAFAGVGLCLVVLHFMMKGPVWHLITRIDITAGNSSWHRYVLVDGFITHWDEWWFMGSRVGSAHWGHFAFDTSNQFVATGLQGGIVLLALLLAIIILAIRNAGRISEVYPLLGWVLGVAVFVQCFSFIGVSIFGQMHFTWALSLAMVSGLSSATAMIRKQSLQRVEYSGREEWESSYG
ncbi:hypothetical protein DTL42_15405 [Bremerella cremea]|uniref:O-antigen ligase family protein n=1 Tax=Bremerella cremea TaxID=1031537 RepID=A0A368KP80_9BACT|nr:hypothetical protein [Bremerella cremea]RCS46353.1 hypothetical protein DTL42_15405 [Bremerella cremea]